MARRQPGERLDGLVVDPRPLAAHGSTSREAPRSIVRCDGAMRVDVAGSSSVPRLRSQRGCEPPAMTTRIRLPAANRCATASSSSRMSPLAASGSRRTEAFAHVPGASVRRHLGQADEQVGVRVVGGVGDRHDRGTQDLERCGQSRTGERDDVATLGQRGVVGVAADPRGQDAATDRRRRVHRVVGELRTRCPRVRGRHRDRRRAGGAASGRSSAGASAGDHATGPRR